MTFGFFFPFFNEIFHELGVCTDSVTNNYVLGNSLFLILLVVLIKLIRWINLRRVPAVSWTKAEGLWMACTEQLPVETKWDFAI